MSPPPRLPHPGSKPGGWLGKAAFSRAYLKRTNTASRGQEALNPRVGGSQSRAHHPPLQAREGFIPAAPEIRSQGCSRFIWFSFPSREVPAEEATARQFHSVVKRQPGLCSLGWLVGLGQFLGW